MLDLIFRGAILFDGTGADAYPADVGICGDRIARIGDLKDQEAAQVIDAEGLWLTPGFIDMHSHADQTVLAYPTMDSMLHQGITTFVGCQCGQSIAPIGRYWLGNQAEYDILAKLTPKCYPDMYDEDYYTHTEDTRPLIAAEHGFSPGWTTFGQWLDTIDAHGLSGNIVPLLGYSTIRMNVMGPDGAHPPTEEERRALKAHIEEAMDAGAFGLSTGLDYKPGIFSGTPELLDMTTNLKRHGGIYFTHWRKTGLRAGTPKKQKKIDGIREGLRIGQENEIQVQLSHLSSGFDVFPAEDDYMQVAAAERTLQVIDEAIARGVRAHFDVIPNTTGGTMIAPDLAMLFRPWYHLTGGLPLFIQNLRGRDYRDQIAGIIYAGRYFVLNPLASPDWAESISILACADGSLVGKTLQQIGDAWGKPPLEAAFDLLVLDPATKIFRATHSMNLGAVKTYLRHPEATVGNDTFVFDLRSTVSYRPDMPANKPNPNTYCGFVKYVTQLGMERMEDTLRKITGKPADILGLSDRGYVREGHRADLLLIDPGTLDARENRIEPRQYPTGIAWVLVNGVPVLRQGELTGALPGGAIRRQER